MIRNRMKEIGKMYFGELPYDFTAEFEGHLKPGDIIEIKEGMMLIEPIDPALVLKADNEMGLYEIMYLRNNYVINCGRMDIRCRLN